MFKSLDIINLREAIQNIINTESKEQKEVGLDPHLIGHEKNGILLLSWKQLVPETNSNSVDATVSVVGLYNTSSHVCKVVYVHETDSDIINATVNEQQTFLGFVTKHQKQASASYSRRYIRDVYRAYLAEINPQKRVFYLNLERYEYILLQFLYGKHKCYNLARELHLLVILHHDSVGLYHLPQICDGDKGWILGAEPKKEQLFFKNIMWAEWDFISQRLYILYPTKPTRLNGYTRKNLLSCYQFTENLIAQNTFELCLDIPIPFCDDQSEFGSLYYEANGSRVIPDVCLKMRVLSKENGTLCICYQHNGHLSSPTTCNTFSPQTGINKSNGESNSDRCKGLEHCGETVSEYTVILVHKKKTLCCERLSLMPSLLYEMIFFWYGSYLVVHVPGCWTHLINTESDEPSLHNIMWTDPEWHPDQSQSHGIKLDTVLVPVNWKARKSLGSYIYQNQSLHLIQLNPSTLCKMFITQPTKRVALLHLAVVHVEDLSFIKELLSMICEDVIPSTVELFQEFLIGSTYTQFCHIAPKWACQLVPCTVDGENHTMTSAEIPANSSSLHRLTYKYGLRLEKQLIVVRNLGAHHKYWIQLSMNLKMASASKSVRFSHRSLSTAVTRHQSVTINSHGDSSRAERSSPGFINKLKRLFRVVSVPETSCLGNPQYAHQMAAQEASIKIDKEVMKWKAEAVFGRLPKFLDPDQKGSSCSELVVKFISEHLEKYRPMVKQEQVQTLAYQYIQSQMYYSTLLVHIICSTVQSEGLYDDMPVEREASMVEKHLFKLLERYYLAVQQLHYPVPPGFFDYFLTLAYKCLHFKIFLQYIENGVLMLSMDFVLLIIRTLRDDRQGLEVKSQLISRLPKLDSLKCLRVWGHPSALEHYSYHYTASALAGSPSDVQRDLNVPANDDPALCPLNLFLDLIDRQKGKGDKESLDADRQLLTSSILSTFR